MSTFDNVGMTPEIRRFRPADEHAMYDICLRTGDHGEDATGMYEDPALIGHVYVGPYVSLAPELAFVAADEDGVCGYVIGAVDTRAFEQASERVWWPSLRERYPRGSVPAESRDAGLVRLLHEPPEAEQDVVERYPAHLHIDLLPRLQGRGYGRRLLSTLFDALRELGAPGVHLGVSLLNEKAMAFYDHVGFTEVRRHPRSLVLARTL